MGRIVFEINGEEYSVSDGEEYSGMTLVDYLRMRAELRGTKYMCREGGCGACIVSVVMSPGDTPKAVNSCLVLITQCHGWKITTIEKVGNRKDGYHVIQKTFADNHATQCGHCTPGWIMAMYSLAQSKKGMTQLELENSFGSNICRCTGYRPIMSAIKTFGSDAENSKIVDIEDLYVCKKTNKPCNKSCGDEEDWCFLPSKISLTAEEPLQVTFKDGKKWFKVTDRDQIFDILRKEGSDDYMLVSGNTARGAFPIDEFPNLLIDISGVSELRGYEMDQNLVIRANNTITELLDILDTVSKEDNFNYLTKLHDHIQKIAHIPVRNLGSIAGNLMTKHKHNNFPSDIFLLLTTVDAYLNIMDSQGTQQRVPMEEFLKLDMKEKLIYEILLPPLSNKYKLVTFKVMPRAQSSPAVVNSGFLCSLDSNNVVQSARLVYGGLSSTFFRATETEKYLVGKKLFDNNTLQSTLQILDKEIVVDEKASNASVAYRRQLVHALFYKALLTLCPADQLNPRYQSGTKRLYDSRPVSKSEQNFPTNASLFPLNQPIQKVESMMQCSGEIKYTDDMTAQPREIFTAFVLTTVAQGNIVSIDASEALKIPGVIAFYSAKDIPGDNSFMLLGVIVFIRHEEIFCSDKVGYYNQPLGIIAADTTEIAERAAKKVKVTYSNVKQPVIDVGDASKDATRTTLFLPIPNIGRGLFVYKEFQSTYRTHGQMHFCMELMACLSRPMEENIQIHASTQWKDAAQYAAAQSLKLDHNRVEVYTRRLGGGFGLKVTRSNWVAVACALVSYLTNRPCRSIPSFSQTARAIGKRMSSIMNVQVQVDRKGLIQYLNCDLYEDNGHVVSELLGIHALSHNNCYKRLWWNYKSYDSITDKARNTYCRAPGTLENLTFSETVMEQISYELSLDPYDVRMTNVDMLLFSDIKVMGEDLKKKAQYDVRKAEVEKFNAENRWVKRGLRWAFMKYFPLCPNGFEVSVSICHGDGSVNITHSGVEMGQGINTKAIQICAYFLKVPVDKIKVKAANTMNTPNSLMTSSSITSQGIGMGVESCCKKLLARLAPLRILLLNPSWPDLIKKAHGTKIPLTARHYVNDLLSPIFNAFGVTLSEVEVDILTGESQVRRVDILEDVGQSVSPQIDVGQVEGAFIMGMSFWMFEDLKYDSDTGEIVTDRPWSYHVAQCKDIPQDFRVSFREKSYSAPIVLGAKVTGEPAVCMAISVPFAMRQAVQSARLDSNKSASPWFDVHGAFTTEKVCLLADTKLEHFKFN